MVATRYVENLLVEVQERFGGTTANPTTMAIYATNADGHHRDISDGGTVGAGILNDTDANCRYQR